MCLSKTERGLVVVVVVGGFGVGVGGEETESGVSGVSGGVIGMSDSKK